MPTFDANEPSHHRWNALSTAFIALIAIGCQDGAPTRQAVRGSVIVGADDGVNGSIMFFPDAGQSGPATGTVVDDGRYRFDSSAGPLPGKYRVVLTLDTTTDESSSEPDAASIAGKADLIAASDAIAQPFPAANSSKRYQSFVTVSTETEQILDVTFAAK